MKQTPLTDLIAPPFFEVHKAIRSVSHSEYWLKGGRGSTKSSFAAIEIVLGIMKHPDSNALCLRKVQATIRDSIQQNILWAIDMLGVTEYFDSKISPAEVTYKPTGQKIVFKGLDKARKLKSIKLRTGYFKYLWFEELEEFEGMEEIRNVKQSVKRGGKDFIEIYSYNPPDDVANWVNIESCEEVKGRYVHHSTYLDVPVEWLGQEAFDDAEMLKARDYDKYRHEYLGEVVGRTDKIVFNGRWRSEEIEPNDGEIFYFGFDFGFANDPSVVLRAWVDNTKREIYVDHCHHAVGLEIDDHHRLLDRIPESTRFRIRADNSRPETISYINRQGFDIVSCKKWSGSIEDGVEWLRSYEIVVHPRCKLLIENLRLYSYKLDSGGNITPRLVDKNNDAMDALRYALEPLITNTVYVEPKSAPKLYYNFGSNAFMS